MTKSRKRMLLSSIAMLLVALVALGSATYAWFTINKTVQADFIKVQAMSAKGLVITNAQNPGDNDWGSTASFGDSSSTATGLQPISFNVATNAAMPTTGIVAGDVKKTGGGAWNTSVTDITDFKEVTDALPDGTTWDDTTKMFAKKTYVTRYDVKVAADGSEALANNLNASIGVTGDKGKQYAKAALVYHAGSGETATHKVIAYYSDDAYTAITSTTPSASGGTASVAASATPSVSNILSTSSIPVKASALHFTLYVWFEGNDQHCTDANQPGSTTNFTLTFSLAS